MTRHEAMEIIKPLEQQYKNSGLNGFDILTRFSDKQLFAYIALATFAFGRSWSKAIENAEYHLENRNNAIKCFATKQTDLLGATN